MTRANESRDASEPGGLRAGPTLPAGARIACVVSSYHADVTGEMAASARDTLLDAGLPPEDLLQVRAPGAFELPLLALRLARRPDVSAVLCFGLVLRGETTHDRHIAAAVAHGLMRAALDTETPMLFGVLTCNDLDQARARARRLGDGGLDKGREVALAAIGALSALREAAGRPGVEEGASR